MTFAARNLLKRSKKLSSVASIFKETELTALAHIGDDFDRSAQVGIGVPCRRKDGEVSFDEIILERDISPYTT
ncbi:hypothetical protein ACVWZ3_000911 [Bradyrhizobium sp. i1.3.6]